MHPGTWILLFAVAGLTNQAGAECGQPCPDQDKDGVVDAVDQCPDSEPGAPVTIRGCAHDSDGDGVPEYRDKCPDQPTESVDQWGCASATEIALPGVSFAVNSARLLDASFDTLNDAVEVLRRYDNLEAEIAGHTDDSGSAAHNRQLSRQRADAVRRYLVEAGIDAQRLTARGYGESRPIASNESEDGRSKNRRVILRILSGQLRAAEN